MTSNDDNAFMTLSNTNPFEVVMYEYNGGDSRIGADITTYMNGYKDPRREAMFTKSTFSRGTNGYYGLRSGITVILTITLATRLSTRLSVFCRRLLKTMPYS